MLFVSRMIGQFCRDVIGCKTQVAFVSSDLVSFDPSVKLGRKILYASFEVFRPFLC